jgi:hypothetical protein
MTPTTRATALGFSAILMWSLLALLTAASGRMPPFQLAAMTFLIGGLIGAATWIVRRDAISALWQNWRVWALGLFGLFGYHALYFMALRLAPPAESGLINYLWPLLIVLFSSFLPGERLRAHHVIGAALGFVGTIVLIAGRAQLGLVADFIPGYAAAFVARSCGRSIRCCRAALRRCRRMPLPVSASSPRSWPRCVISRSRPRCGRRMRPNGLRCLASGSVRWARRSMCGMSA